LFDILIIGGGASGFMAAITAKELRGDLRVAIFEKSPNFLSKVRISGGGRCNVTNAERLIKPFSKKYPRGEKVMFKMLHEFGVEDTINWFEKRGVRLKTEPDGRMFPTTNNSLTIVDCLMRTARELGVEMYESRGVETIKVKEDASFSVLDYKEGAYTAKKLIFACGGFPKIDSYDFLKEVGANITIPVPSLFTLNSKSEYLGDLAGVSVPNATVKLVGSKIESSGPLLLTHWGLSGPAALVLSAFGARELAEKMYTCKLLVHWEASSNYNQTQALIEEFAKANPKKVIVGHALLSLPSRLWKLLCEQADIDDKTVWLDISNKKKNKLLENLVNFSVEMKGKSTNKDEFVTCGGVSLEAIDSNTMALKNTKNVYFCGEVLDIDAVTGGFNFQAAWSTGYLAGKGSVC
jgi:predicted Rossmann fold flavoprotein